MQQAPRAIKAPKAAIEIENEGTRVQILDDLVHLLYKEWPKVVYKEFSFRRRSNLGARVIIVTQGLAKDDFLMEKLITKFSIILPSKNS